MITVRDISERLYGKWMVEAMIELLEEQFDDFPEMRKNYIAAMQKLKQQLGDDPSVSIEELEEAIEQQLQSDLLFSAVLGIKANLDNFINPVSKNFLDTDFEVFLREEMAHGLPGYSQGSKKESKFFAQLDKEQQKIYGDIQQYTTYLETTAPKVAHYYGFLMGEDLLYRIVPGYYSDISLQVRYSHIMKKYFGKHMDWLWPQVNWLEV